MRTSFWRGVVAGGVIGAALSMIVGDRQSTEDGVRETGEKARRILRGARKSVNNLIK